MKSVLQVVRRAWNVLVIRDRGDVPGWVLITVMTAGLVVAIWSVADGQLKAILSSALHSVSQP
jgi:adenine C2-methylase RlmN of 23S rRNA A2503 and tRNA A37